MSFEAKEDLQRVCEAVLSYQKGLEEVDKYIGRLNSYMAELTVELKEAGVTQTFNEYGKQLEDLRAQCEHLKKIFKEIQDGQSGLVSQLKILGRFQYAVRNFEDTMKSFTQRADSLSQKLYNKDFNNAIKAMNAIAEETRQSGTYEYRHVTDHDYDILTHEYEQSLKACKQKTPIKDLMTGVYEALCGTRLKREEHESLQRLIEKMVHSDSNALKKFLTDVMNEQEKRRSTTIRRR